MEHALQLDRRSGIPLYVQIKNILMAELASSIADDTRLTEQSLAKRFHVSRSTVRQALKDLVQDGLVFRERSKGTFPVQRLGVDRPATLQVGGLVSYLADQGLNPSSEVRDVRRVVPPEEVAATLGLEKDERVLTFTRTVLANGEPWSLARVYLRSPNDFLPTAEELEAAGSAMSLLEKTQGVAVVRSEHRVWATLASPQVAASLTIQEGAPVLILETVMSTREGRPMVWRRLADRADTIKHTFIADL